MSADYQVVQWNKLKKVYDLFIIIGLIVYLGIFVSISLRNYDQPQAISPMIILIRALGSCAFLMLHIILIIGPLARLSSIFKPLLYNRRHFGVSMCIVATAHIGLVLIWYYGYGVISPLYALFISNPNYESFARFPFELYGAAAYLIILLMALTSHDFWLKLFSAPVWKILHMLVYLAYGLLVIHVLTGFIQTEGSLSNLYLLATAVIIVVSLHLTSAFREWQRDKRNTDDGEWVKLCPARSITNEHGKGFTLKNGDKIAVFRYDNNKIVAVANACAHQNGPLCEGRVVNGNIVCPWHGYEYIPTTGRSPSPFTEKLATYKVRIKNRTIQVNQKPNPPGTPTKAAIIR